MRVVKSIYEKFTGTYRTIYIDILYTFMELLRELNDMLIFAMGAMMNNRTPKELPTTKRSLEYKEMSRGR